MRKATSQEHIQSRARNGGNDKSTAENSLRRCSTWRTVTYTNVSSQRFSTGKTRPASHRHRSASFWAGGTTRRGSEF